jgi:hypothetical protein
MIKLKDIIKEAVVNINSKFNSELIDNINDEYRENFTTLTPKEINNGYCDMWAKLFVEKFGGKHQWTFDIPNDVNGHAWVKLNNKFYDAEVPKGVSKLEEIPYIQRAISKLKSSEWLDNTFYKNIQQ